MLPSHFLSKGLSLYLSHNRREIEKGYHTGSGGGERKGVLSPTAKLHFPLSWVISFFMKKLLKLLQVVESLEKTNFNMAMHDIGME